jgi:uncharacterized membrane protein (UPF0127 family)
MSISMSIRSVLKGWFGREKDSAQVSIWNETRGTLLADAADLADSSDARRRGLLKHDSLSPGQGLWIVPCESVHSCGMKFEIDLVYLDRNLRVRKLRKEMPPWRMSICFRAQSVLELPAGTIASTGTQTGDQLTATVKSERTDVSVVIYLTPGGGVTV